MQCQCLHPRELCNGVEWDGTGREWPTFSLLSGGTGLAAGGGGPLSSILLLPLPTLPLPFFLSPTPLLPPPFCLHFCPSYMTKHFLCLKWQWRCPKNLSLSIPPLPQILDTCHATVEGIQVEWDSGGCFIWPCHGMLCFI